MRSKLLASLVACTVLLGGCGGGPGADAPRDASLEDFCAAQSWMVDEGVSRFSTSKDAYSHEALAELIHDWGEELARVGTPENTSEDARAGFEKAVERLAELEAGDVDDASYNWDPETLTGEDEKAFARYVTNSCP